MSPPAKSSKTTTRSLTVIAAVTFVTIGILGWQATQPAHAKSTTDQTAAPQDKFNIDTTKNLSLTAEDWRRILKAI